MTSPDAADLDVPGGPGFRQIRWDAPLARHAEELALGWLAEDLGHECDWTSVGLVAAEATCRPRVVARRSGVIAGLPAAAVVATVADRRLIFEPRVADGTAVAAGSEVAVLAGPTRSVLAAERVVLNLLGRLSGIATATRRLVDAVAGTRCRVYDTRKTVPGWRLLDKYATRVGGGWNHRLGLYDAILVKDNHLAALAAAGLEPAEAVRRARTFLDRTFPPPRAAAMVVEIEIDTPEQLGAVLEAGPDIVLLDNMGADALAGCVALRDRIAPRVLLEASGGIRPDTAAMIARSGVDRISTGWPAHDAAWLDLALDYS
ncbi:MAG: carboxylating nicotinate-nucleotide diphosphorylase [Planctomycetes bacterium]|nr:carboxylating nicotinate-nucleotide diphosphorylase [Planctomycetota bacterium]